MKLFTDSIGIEFYNKGESFFAESSPLSDAGDLYVIEVAETVKTQITHEADGIQVFKVLPDQVISIN